MSKANIFRTCSLATNTSAMKILISTCILLVLASCGGSLSDEQRRQMREKMEENKIVRVTEVEITEAAFEHGRRAVATLDSLKSDSARIEAFIRSYRGSIRYLAPGDKTDRLLEKQLLDAYLADTSGSFQDNVQNVRNESGEVDSLLYTYPHTSVSENGTRKLLGVWNVWLSKKNVVKGVGKFKIQG